MFEHMKNYQTLLKKVSTWLRPKVNRTERSPHSEPDQALLFVHIFCHRSMPYHFQEKDGWMAQTFFSGTFLLVSRRMLVFDALNHVWVAQAGRCPPMIFSFVLGLMHLTSITMTINTIGTHSYTSSPT